jgi:hypothetical protein
MLHGVSILALSDISKSFPGVTVLDSLEIINELRPQGVDITVYAFSTNVSSVHYKVEHD